VDHAGGVHGDDGLGQPDGQTGQLLVGERAVLCHEVGEVPAGTYSVTRKGWSAFVSASR